MKPEDKDLLLRDLCARLPYGILCNRLGKSHELLSIVPNKKYCLELYNGEYASSFFTIDDVMPYLRPMSSMTEEEKHKLLKFGAVTCLENGEVVDVSCVGFERHTDIQDYLNACHLDYRGLIEKGLALEAPVGMYNVK